MCVLLGTVLRTFWLQNNSKYNFLFGLSTIDVVVYRHEHESHFSSWILFSSIVLWISRSNCIVECLGKCVHSSAIDKSPFSRDFVNHSNVASKLLLVEVVYAFCQHKYPNQSKGVSLLSTIWRLCRVAKSFSIMELYPKYVRYFDSRSVSAKYRTTARLSKSVFLVVRRLSWWSCPRCIAAFYVADIHIHQIIAVTSMSSISSLCWRLNFCRQFEQICSRWQTLFLDILTLCWDNFVPCGFLVVSATGLSVLVFIFTSGCHTW